MTIRDLYSRHSSETICQIFVRDTAHRWIDLEVDFTDPEDPEFKAFDMLADHEIDEWWLSGHASGDACIRINTQDEIKNMADILNQKYYWSLTV